MNKKGKIRKIYSWPVIIIVLLYFWPVGLFLIYKRLSLEENKRLAIAEGLEVGSVAWLILSVIVIVMLLLFSGGPVVTFPILLSNGLVSLIMRRISKKIKRQEQYISIIQNREMMLVDELVAASGISYKVVKKDIKKMIRKGNLKNAVFDETKGIIQFHDVISNTSSNVASKELCENMKEQPVSIKLEKYLTRVVSCSDCGAKNVRNHHFQTCEYCGSQVQ